MTEFLQSSGVWFVTGSLMILGLAGCILPILPGHLLILCGAIGFRLMEGVDSGLSWWGVGVMGALMLISQVFEIVSGSLGSRWFGGTKWGALGALVGGVVGIFFLPIGLLLGPLIGAFGLELAFGSKAARPAAVSGVGSVVGTLAGIGVKVAVAIAMIVCFLVDIIYWNNEIVLGG